MKKVLVLLILFSVLLVQPSYSDDKTDQPETRTQYTVPPAELLKIKVTAINIKPIAKEDRSVYIHGNIYLQGEVVNGTDYDIESCNFRLLITKPSNGEIILDRWFEQKYIKKYGYLWARTSQPMIMDFYVSEWIIENWKTLNISVTAHKAMGYDRNEKK